MKHIFTCGLASASFLYAHGLVIPSTMASTNEEVAQERDTTGFLNPKYFWEAGSGPTFSHYDLRFYPGSPVASSTKIESLHHLTVSYFRYLSSLNIQTWLAHGSLLGWFWNGEVLPWDTDLDVQIWADDLYKLGKVNMTLYDYSTVIVPATKRSVSKESELRVPQPTKPVVFKRRYLLDVNPYHISRDGLDWKNVIDARWIDTVTGLFIDITGLSDTGSNAWACKNHHQYPKSQLSRETMISTVFESVRVIVPKEYKSVLSTEYGSQALVNEKYNKYTFFQETGEWAMDGTTN